MTERKAIRNTRSAEKSRKKEVEDAKQKMVDLNIPIPDWADAFLTKQQEMFSAFKQTLDQKLELKFEELNKSIKEIKKDSKAIMNRLGKAEERIGKVEENQETEEKTIKTLTADVRDLKAKISYMESHSRRNNILLVGLREGKDPGTELAAILRYILGRSDEEHAPEVDRHHRALRPRPDPDQPPRPYIIRMLRWEDRQLILKAAAKKGRLEWGGKAFHVFQDFPVEIQRRRAEYAEIKEKLRGTGHRYGLLFPARLIVTIDDVKHIYSTPKEAFKDLKVRLPSVF